MRLAVDIGYSNLKGLYGKSQSGAQVFCMPAGAGPNARAARALRGEASGGGIAVDVGGRPWIAGLSPASFSGHVRELHERYPATDTYLALYRAALTVCGAEQVENVVTGLPIAQYMDKTFRVALGARLQGAHTLVGARRVHVSHVLVVPQAVGAFLDYAADGRWRQLAEHGRVLVIDVGFFSVDWALIDDGAWQPAASGSSVHAFSRVLEEVAALFQTRHHAKVSAERIEKSVRDGEPTLLVHGEAVALSDVWPQAVAEVAPVAMSELQRQLRVEPDALDLVLLTGGGAGSYLQCAREVFPHAKVDSSHNPVLANARGYWGAVW